MSDSKALRIVAILFLLTGIEAVIEFFCSFSQNRLLIPFGILGFFVYAHLPAYRRGWRTVALVLLWIPMICFPLFGIIGIFSPGPFYIDLFGFHVAEVPLPIALAWSAIWWLLNVWQYRVLTRPSIREKFYATPQAA